MSHKKILSLILGTIISFGSISQTTIQVCAENIPSNFGFSSTCSISKPPKIPVLKKLSKKYKNIFTSRDGLIFKIIDDNNVMLYGIKEEKENIIIPQQVKISKTTYNVNSIGHDIFRNYSNIKFVSLPESIENIEEGAFRGCSNLKLTKLPNGIKMIGNAAFAGCTNLLLTHLPSGIRTQPETEDLCGIPCPTKSQEKDPYWWEEVTSSLKRPIPGTSVAGIGDYVFKGCTNLQLTELPNGITKIGESAFEGCTNLQLTELPNGITKIGGSAFKGCTNLQLTELPDGITSIGRSAFEDSNIEKISLPASVTDLELYSLKTESLREITLLTKDSLTIQDIHMATGFRSMIRGSIVINNGIQNDIQNTVAEDESGSSLHSGDMSLSDNSDVLYEDSSDISTESSDPN